MRTESGQASRTDEPVHWESLLGEFRQIIAQTPDPLRYRCLAELLTACAETPGRPANAESTDQARSLARKCQELELSLAELKDASKALELELEIRDRQLQQAKLELQSHQKTAHESRTQAQAVADRVRDLQARLDEITVELQTARAENEKSSIQLQRAKLAMEDHSQVAKVERDKVDLAEQVKTLSSQLEQLRQEKNVEIERLQQEDATTRDQVGAGGGEALAAIWDRLASAKPSLTRGGLVPTQQAGQRLVDSTIEFATSFHKLEQSMQAFLDRYVKGSALQTSWRAYAEQQDLYALLRQLLDPVESKPVALLKIRARNARQWIMAGMVANDVTIESIADRLTNTLEEAVRADARATIRDFLRNSGPEKFQDYVMRLRREKLEEAARSPVEK